MKYFDWDETKNEQLKAERDIGFEDVIIAIDEGKLLDIVDHPNRKRYPGQRIFIIEMYQYVYYVPYVEDEAKVFLKTIIPSRRATKKYIISRKQR